MILKYYCVCLVFYKDDNNNVFPVVTFHEAISKEEAYTQALIRDYTLDYLKKGYRIGFKLIEVLSTSICPSNSDSDLIYKIEQGKATHVTINLQLTLSSFNQELKELINKYWIS